LDLIEILADSEEYPAFKQQALIDLITYKWDTTGFNFHIVSFVNHSVYMFFLIIYIGRVYILDALHKIKEVDGEKIRIQESNNSFALLLMMGLILPGILCGLQIHILGVESLVKGEFPMTMYFELIYIASNIINSLIQYQLDP